MGNTRRWKTSMATFAADPVMYRKLSSTWRGMVARCTITTDPKYESYGAKGVTLCEEWRASLEAFAIYIGAPPTLSHSIDRIDNSRGYEPGNVRWATAKQQSRNRTICRYITAFGKTLCLGEWSETYGVPKSTISQRIYLGWEIERAVSEPPSHLRKYPNRQRHGQAHGHISAARYDAARREDAERHRVQAQAAE